MIVLVGEFSLKELLLVIELFCQEGAVLKDVVGEWLEIIELFNVFCDEADFDLLLKNIFEVYDGLYYECKKNWEFSQEDKMELEKMVQDLYI